MNKSNNEAMTCRVPGHRCETDCIPDVKQHTPTPWYCQKFDDTKSTSLYQQFGTATLGSIKKKENAEFIVRAVNSHEALLRAAKDFKDFLREGYDEDNTSLMESVDRVIALAEGRQS